MGRVGRGRVRLRVWRTKRRENSRVTSGAREWSGSVRLVRYAPCCIARSQKHAGERRVLRRVLNHERTYIDVAAWKATLDQQVDQRSPRVTMSRQTTLRLYRSLLRAAARLHQLQLSRVRAAVRGLRDRFVQARGARTPGEAIDLALLARWASAARGREAAVGRVADVPAGQARDGVEEYYGYRCRRGWRDACMRPLHHHHLCFSSTHSGIDFWRTRACDRAFRARGPCGGGRVLST